MLILSGDTSDYQKVSGHAPRECTDPHPHLTCGMMRKPSLMGAGTPLALTLRPSHTALILRCWEGSFLLPFLFMDVE